MRRTWPSTHSANTCAMFPPTSRIKMNLANLGSWRTCASLHVRCQGARRLRTFYQVFMRRGERGNLQQMPHPDWVCGPRLKAPGKRTAIITSSLSAFSAFEAYFSESRDSLGGVAICCMAAIVTRVRLSESSFPFQKSGTGVQHDHHVSNVWLALSHMVQPPFAEPQPKLT